MLSAKYTAKWAYNLIRWVPLVGGFLMSQLVFQTSSGVSEHGK